MVEKPVKGSRLPPVAPTAAPAVLLQPHLPLHGGCTSFQPQWGPAASRAHAAQLLSLVFSRHWKCRLVKNKSRNQSDKDTLILFQESLTPNFVIGSPICGCSGITLALQEGKNSFSLPVEKYVKLCCTGQSERLRSEQVPQEPRGHARSGGGPCCSER